MEGGTGGHEYRKGVVPANILTRRMSHAASSVVGAQEFAHRKFTKTWSASLTSLLTVNSSMAICRQRKTPPRNFQKPYSEIVSNSTRRRNQGMSPPVRRSTLVAPAAFPPVMPP